MSKNKKPTMMEVKTAINNLIKEMGYIQQAILHISNSFNAYLEFKEDKENLTNWLKEQIIKEDINDGSRDDESEAGTIRSSDKEDRGTAGKDKVIGIKKSKSKAKGSEDAGKYT